MDFTETIKNCIPDVLLKKTGQDSAGGDLIDWDLIEGLFSLTCFSGMKTTFQNTVYHGEGDVFTHTKMVCESLVNLPVFSTLSERQKTQLFLAAILHDIGKVKTTRMEDGIWTSPNHSSVGSRIAREFLWRDCGLCGTSENMVFRETVCALVRYHMLPVYLTDLEEPERKVRRIAAIGELADGFSWDMLCILSEADAIGRIADDAQELLTRIQLARILAKEAGCLNGPGCFADSFTKHAYLSGRKVQPDQTLYDDTWGEVLMVCGLPGTGKDTWIARNLPDKPVVSLDGLRTELGIKPSDNQGSLIQTAMERAREHLRRKQPFLWNATNVTKDTRQKLTGLFERYGARVRIVYLETDWEERTKRNAGRKMMVPEDVVVSMLAKTVLPMPDEAQTVEWIGI